jgi:hypothetical protein
MPLLGFGCTARLLNLGEQAKCAIDKNTIGRRSLTSRA